MAESDIQNIGGVRFRYMATADRQNADKMAKSWRDKGWRARVMPTKYPSSKARGKGWDVWVSLTKTVKHRIQATDHGRYLTYCGKILHSREGQALSAHEMWVAKNPCKACLKAMDGRLMEARAKGYDKHPMDR